MPARLPACLREPPIPPSLMSNTVRLVKQTVALLALRHTEELVVVRMLGPYEQFLAAQNVELAHAVIYPEDEFEARLVHTESVRHLIARDGSTLEDARVRYLYASVDIQRARRHAGELQELYSGRCQICLYNPQEAFGHRTCHGHHIHWLPRGGDDELGNMVLVCPNHHAAIDRDDAAFDYGT
jgi:5-methylcytosine-specific restriction enzyme A